MFSEIQIFCSSLRVFVSFGFQQKNFNKQINQHIACNGRNTQCFSLFEQHKIPFDETHNQWYPKLVSCFSFWFWNVLVFSLFVLEQKFLDSNTLHIAAEIRNVFCQKNLRQTFRETQIQSPKTFYVFFRGASGVGVGFSFWCGGWVFLYAFRVGFPLKK